jgi:hypothetical protein
MPMPVKEKAEKVKVADEVWIVAALLHKEHPESPDFTVEEILERARVEGIVKPLSPGVYVHVSQHCVANRRPYPNRYRMLTETSPGRRRLFRDGDPYHPQREGAKTTPERDELPEEYRELLDWYREWNKGNVENRIKNDPLLALRGSGRKLWADEHTDEYVRRIREGWE